MDLAHELLPQIGAWRGCRTHFLDTPQMPHRRSGLSACKLAITKRQSLQMISIESWSM
jgi:hypothetical protein